jgi:hypothetical protein
LLLNFTFAQYYEKRIGLNDFSQIGRYDGSCIILKEFERRDFFEVVDVKRIELIEYV